MSLGKQIEQKMKDLSLTQMKLAQKSGLTQQAISNMILEKSKPSYDAIVVLSKALQVTPLWFFEDSKLGESKPFRPGLRSNLSPEQVDVKFFPSLGHTDPDRQGKRPKKTIFVIGHYLPMKDLSHPIQAYPSGIADTFYSLIFNTLVRLQDGQLQGELAVDWKNIGKSWLFRIREGARFHNRKRVTTEDVRWSYEQYLLQNPDERWIDNVEVLDESVVAIYVKSPCRVEDLPAVFILPAGTEESPTRWVGSGPFVAVELNPGSWRLRKNAHYFRAKPFFDEVKIREYNNPGALQKALVYGDVHFAVGIYVPEENLVPQAESAIQRYHLHFMLNEPLVQNRALRKAIGLGLDREALAKAAGLRNPLYSTMPFDYTLGDQHINPPRPDVETAKQLLKHVPELNGSILRVKGNSAFSHQPQLTEAIVEQLNGLGIQAEIGENPHVVLTMHNVGHLELEFRLWESGDRFNFNGYCNSRVDQLIQQYQQKSPTPTQLWELRELIHQDVPDIPLFYNERLLTHTKRLHTLENRNPSITRLNEIHTWYLEANDGDEDRR